MVVLHDIIYQFISIVSYICTIMTGDDQNLVRFIIVNTVVNIIMVHLSSDLLSNLRGLLYACSFQF